MKKLFLTVITAATTLGATIPLANAAPTSSTFAVTATLTSACTIGTFSGGVAFGTVQAFIAPSSPTSATAIVRCTRGFAAPAMSFDASPSEGTGSSITTGATPTGAGVLPNGLYYTLSASYAARQNGTAPTTSGLNSTRDADENVVTVTGTMPAQAGTNTGNATHTRTMTITF